jgi:hypothetical protein
VPRGFRAALAGCCGSAAAPSAQGDGGDDRAREGCKRWWFTLCTECLSHCWK